MAQVTDVTDVVDHQVTEGPARRSRQQAVDEWRASRSRDATPPAPAAAAVAQQVARGKLLAHERIELLLDPGSFQELQALAATVDNPWLRGKRALGDGVMTGSGTVDGRPVFVFAQDPTVIGGSLGSTGGAKIHRLMDLAIEAGAPIVGIYDGGGARIQEGVASLCAFGGIFLRNTRASGVVPQISLAMGTAVGGAVYSPALTDFVLMVEPTSAMAITGPRVVREVTGEDVTLRALGGASVHAERSGLVHHVAADEPACLAAARRLLGFLPSSNRHRPPIAEAAPPLGGADGPGLLDVLPAETDAPYDVRRVVERIVDTGDLFEYAPAWAPNIVCGLARLGGRPVGVVANQRDRLDGRLDVDACDKAARFVRTCDAFALPVVTVVDTPGVVAGPGPGSEQYGAVRAGAKLAHAYAEATTARVHVIVGDAHGPAAAALGATRATSDVRLAWPTADVASYGPNGPNGSDGFGRAARHGLVDAVIEPDETRAAVAHALAVLATVERAPVPRKHDNIPL
jgi:acetyl-CoA carboxylase carboxyltransferase component